jgi:hypothetical protein
VKPVVQLTEFGITGGVLLFNLFVFATLLSLQGQGLDLNLPHALQVWHRWLEQFAAATQPISGNKAVEAALTTIVATLSVILIFCTGLLLELTAPLFFVSLEIWVFKSCLASRERGWFGKIILAHAGLVGEDYERYLNEPTHAVLRPRRWLAQRARYVRLQSFVFSYLFAHTEGASLERLEEQIRLWHTSRAVSTSMLFLGVLLTLSAQGVNLGQSVVIAVFVPAILFALSTMITVALYSRLCTTMCVLLYLNLNVAA